MEKEIGKRRRTQGRKRRTEIPLKIGSNKLSTIFAGLNTLKRLEIRRPGGPFVRRVAGERHEGLRRVIRTAKREAPGTQKRDEGSWRGPLLLFLPPAVGVYSCARSGYGL